MQTQSITQSTKTRIPIKELMDEAGTRRRERSEFPIQQ